MQTPEIAIVKLTRGDLIVLSSALADYRMRAERSGHALDMFLPQLASKLYRAEDRLSRGDCGINLETLSEIKYYGHQVKLASQLILKCCNPTDAQHLADELVNYGVSIMHEAQVLRSELQENNNDKT